MRATLLTNGASLVRGKLIFGEHTTNNGRCERGVNIILNAKIRCTVCKHKFKRLQGIVQNVCPRIDISQIYFLQKRTNPEKHFPKINCHIDISQIYTFFQNFWKKENPTKPNTRTDKKIHGRHLWNNVKLCRMLKLPLAVAVCFSFISYKFQHQPSSLHAVVSIRVNGIWDVRSVFRKLITFFDIRWIIHYEFVEPGTTVKALYYKTVLQKVKKVVKKKRGSDHHWFLYHDNAPLHHSLIVHQYLAKKAVTAIPHYPYSADLSPCDFLFPQFKRTIKRKRFRTTEEIQLATERELRKITHADFQCCDTQWVECWRRCVNASSKYFKGDH